MKEEPQGEQEDWKQSSQNLQLQNSASQLEDIIAAQVLPKEGKVWALDQAAQPGCLCWEEKNIAGLALKTHQAYFQAIWRLQETDPAILGHTQNLSCSQSLCRVSSLKDTWVRAACASQRASQKSKRQLGLQLGVDTGRPHLESSLQLMSAKGLPHRPPCLEHS